MHEVFSPLSSYLPALRVAAFLLAHLLAASIASAAAPSDDFEESELSGHERAGVMSEYIKPECETIRDLSFDGYYDSEGESSSENGMEEFISPECGDCEDVREDYYDRSEAETASGRTVPAKCWDLTGTGKKN